MALEDTVLKPGTPLYKQSQETPREIVRLRHDVVILEYAATSIRLLP
jgi:hypothetical protein